ncbi:MAG: hypothetical protein ABSB22_19420 [Thermodesulfobacteriota bacterium]
MYRSHACEHLNPITTMVENTLAGRSADLLMDPEGLAASPDR